MTLQPRAHIPTDSRAVNADLEEMQCITPGHQLATLPCSAVTWLTIQASGIVAPPSHTASLCSYPTI